MKTVVCFGCGDLGKYFAESYGEYVTIEYFLDNSNALEKMFCGYDRFIPSQSNCEGKFIIVTNVKYYNDISMQLCSYGLAEDRDFISIGNFEKKYPTIRKELKTVRCWFVDFWDGFCLDDNVFLWVLRREFNVILDDKNPDILFCSVFYRKECRAMQYKCARIFYTGENVIPDFNVYDYALGFEYMIYGDRYLRWPLYRLYSDFELIKMKHINYDMDSFMKRGFCCRVVSNSECEYREKLFEEINKRKYVASGGKSKNNLQGGECVIDKHTFLTQYKFNLAIENANTSGYVTEKIVQAWAAGCIPVYWGSAGTIKREFNKEAFIDCSDFAELSEVANYLLEIENDRGKLESILNAPALSNNYEEDDVLLRFLKNIINKSENERVQRLSEVSIYAKKQEQMYKGV